MKLLVILSTVAVVANYVASAPEPPTDKPDAAENPAAAETTKPFFDFKNFYFGAFPPARFPPSAFLPTPIPTPASLNTLNRPINSFNYDPFRQGILPPISQIIPPQISQIVPPVSQIVPPIFGNVPAPVSPSQPFPPQLFPNAPKPLINKFTFPYSRPLINFSPSYAYASPSTYTSFAPTYTFPSSSAFTSTFSDPFHSLQKQPTPTAQKESLSTSYGPPVAVPEKPEPQGPAESSVSLEPSAISYPYEAAAPEEPEPVAPHNPAQEYGPPAA